MDTTPTPPTGTQPRAAAARMVARLTDTTHEAEHAHPLLGYQVLWDITHCLVPRAELERLLRAYQLAAFLPPAITPKTAIKRALAMMHGDQLVRPVEDTPERVQYALVQEERYTPVDATMPHLRHETTLYVIYDKRAEALSYSTWDAEAVISPLVARYHTSYTQSDISEVLRRVTVSCRSISMRSAGGVYFVPNSAQGRHTLADAQHFVEMLESTYARESYLVRLGVIDREEEREDMRLLVAIDLEAQFKKLDDDVREKEATAREWRERLRENPQARGGVAPETTTTYLLAATKLAEKADLYADLLQYNADRLHERTAAIERRITQLVSRVPWEEEE